MSFNAEFLEWAEHRRDKAFEEYKRAEMFYKQTNEDVMSIRWCEASDELKQKFSNWRGMQPKKKGE